MGYTFWPQGGGEEDAMEGEFYDGRTDEVCDSAQRRRDNGFAVSRVRYLMHPPAAKFLSATSSADCKG